MPQPDASLYPLRFEPILKEKVWGGRRLADFGKNLPEDALIGESWEIADLGATSPGGGGGDPARSIVAAGPLAGASLSDLLASRRREFLGALADSREDFPLLLKLLDARQNLSIQVHPSPAWAAAHQDAHLKHECWCVLDAAPGALIHRDLRPGATRESLRLALEQGDPSDLIHAIPARPGDFHEIPSGTVHALGAGVLVAEIQTPSDTTFRLYDWGRTGRELHIDQALECIDFSGAGPAPKPRRHDAPGRARLAETDAFIVDQINVPGAERYETSPDDRPVAWMCIAGGAELRCDGDIEQPAIGRGDTLLLPAALGTVACEPINPAADGAEFSLLEIRPALDD